MDWQASGLEGYGKPSGYLERQVRRFSGLWEHNKTREVPEIDEGTAWLAANMPESGPATIVHGDYRLGNTMMGPGTPARLVAIFDWELATIGDPLADVGYLTATYAEPGEADGEDTPMSALNAVTTREGFPTRAELIARYEERSGPLDERRELVPDAGHVEVGGVPGGLVQATARGNDRRPVLQAARRGRAGARAPRPGDRAWRLTAPRRAGACSSTSAGS